MSDSSGPETANPGSYVVVARRYRPRGFQELVGQDHVARALGNAIETGRVGHAYLFTGARGVGKTSTARIFAKALNAPDGATPNPDPDTDVALAIDAGEDVDVIEIDGASNRGIDEIRSLRANVGVRPSRSRYKIYIIDEVHMLTQAAFNALLKTLEEPPDHVKFIFCTTDPEKIPITVLSRCQRFDFAPVEVSKIVGRLAQIVAAESASADDAALELIARRAAGSLRDSQSLLEQVLSFSDGHLTADQVHAMLGTADDERLHALATAMANRDAAEALRQLDAAIDSGVDAGRLAEQLLGYFRDLMAVSVGCESTLMRFASMSLYDSMKRLGESWGLQTVLAVVGLIDQTLVRIRHSVHSRVLLESTLIQVCTLPDLQAISDLAASASAADAEKKKRPTLTAVAADRPSPAAAQPPVPRSPQPPATQPRATQAPVQRSSVPAPHLDRPAPSTAPATVAAPSGSAATDPAPSGATGSGPATAGPATDAGTTGGSAFSPETNSPLLANRIDSPQPQPQTPSTPAPTSTSTSPDSAAASSALPNPNVTASPAETGSGGTSAVALRNAWSQALLEMDPITATLARAVDHVESPQPGVLRMVFTAESRMAMNRCELSEHRSEIANTLARVTGNSFTVETATLPPVNRERPATPRPSGRSRMQRMREIESNELVRSCLDLFAAEIVRVDLPRE